MKQDLKNSTLRFAAVKDICVKILVCLLLFSISAETVSHIWKNHEISVTLIEKEEKGSNRETENEKDESKDKIIHYLSLQQEGSYTRSLFVLSNIHLIYSAYLSLPEIPPDLS